jgi:hypothetical protein
MGAPGLNIGLCICGEWEADPQTHTKCAECGRPWLIDVDQVALRLGLLYRIQQQIRIENQSIRLLSSTQGNQIV